MNDSRRSLQAGVESMTNLIASETATLLLRDTYWQERMTLRHQTRLATSADD
jgi:hypothetical protein